MNKEQVYHVDLVNTLTKRITITALDKSTATYLVEDILDDFITTDFDTESGWKINKVSLNKEEGD
jgi:hypothetical protein